MYIKIESDVFDIVERIREIDEYYYILYNVKNGRFELHNGLQKNTYCFTVPYENIDSRVIDLIYKSFIGNIDKLLEEIDENNQRVEREEKSKTQSMTDYMLREIYNFSSNSSKDYDSKRAFSAQWR